MTWIIVASVVALLLFGVVRMAGGNSEDLSFGAYPKGERSVVCLQSNTVSMLASQTGLAWDQIRLPFKCRVVKAEFCGVVALTPTIYAYDDTGTPKEIIGVAATYFALTASATATAQAVTVDSTKVLFSGSLLTLKYTTVASETTTNASLRLWVQPV